MTVKGKNNKWWSIRAIYGANKSKCKLLALYLSEEKYRSFIRYCQPIERFITRKRQRVLVSREQNTCFRCRLEFLTVFLKFRVFLDLTPCRLLLTFPRTIQSSGLVLFSTWRWRQQVEEGLFRLHVQLYPSQRWAEMLAFQTLILDLCGIVEKQRKSFLICPLPRKTPHSLRKIGILLHL